MTTLLREDLHTNCKFNRTIRYCSGEVEKFRNYVTQTFQRLRQIVPKITRLQFEF